MQISMGMTILGQKKIEKAEFDKIMAEHKLWLANHEKGKRADLSDRDLSGMDLSGIDLSYADMEGVNLHDAKLIGTNLSNACLREAFLLGVNLTKAKVDETDFCNATITHAKLNECKGNKTRFLFACMWDCEIKEASLKKAGFLYAEVCDCNFTGSDIEEADFCGADMDNAVFINTNLRNAEFIYSKRTYWCDFMDADMTGARIHEIDLNPENLKGVKGLHMPIFCPEEGSFTAWKKCRDGKVVKLFIPEHAERKGNSLHSCRASEAVVLEIFDKDGNPVEDAASCHDKDFIYRKGETVYPKAADKEHMGDWDGIYFVLSRSETVFFRESEDDNQDDEN